MFHSMRYLGSSLFAKVMVVFIAIAFVVWGIGPELRSTGPSYAARVGDTGISIAEFQHQKALISRQMQAMGVQGLDVNKMDAAVLRQLIQQELLTQEMRHMGLYVNEQLLAKTLRKQPQFTNKDGSFNAVAFQNTLTNARISEGAFLEQMKHEITGRFLIASLDMNDLAPPSSATAIAADAANETRDAVLVTIPAHVPADKITDAAMKEYYDAHTMLYLTPQSRTLEYVTLAPGELDKWTDKSITPEARADAAKADPSASPEKITAQLRADARESAMRNLSNSVEDGLAAGATLGGALEKLGIKAQSHFVQNVTEESAKTFTDETEKTAVAQGMALNDGEISGVITTPHGTTLMVAVKSINQAAPKPLQTVAGQVRNGLSQQLARDDARSKAQDVKAALAKDSNWQAALGKFGLSGRTVGSLPRPVEGKPVASGIPDALQQAIFERKVGEVAGPLTLPNGDQMIAVITALHHPKPTLDAKASAALNKSLTEALNQEIENAAFNDFVSRHPVKVNPQLGDHSADAPQ